MLQTLPFDKLDYQFFIKKNLFVVKSNTDITFEDIIVHVGNVMEDERFYLGINALYDFTRLERITGSVETFLATAEAMSDKTIINTPAKTAILVPDNNQSIYEVFHGYTLMTSASLIEYRIFTESQINSLLAFLELDSLPVFDY